MAMIKLSDPVILSGIAESGKYSIIPIWGKGCFDLCGCCDASSMAQSDAKSFLLHQSRYATDDGDRSTIYETYSLMKFSVQSVMWGWLMARGQNAWTTEDACWLMSMMALDALLSIGDWPDSQVLGIIENLEGRTRESSPDMFSLDRVSLILRFRAPNFAHR